MFDRRFRNWRMKHRFGLECRNCGYAVWSLDQNDVCPRCRDDFLRKCTVLVMLVLALIMIWVRS